MSSKRSDINGTAKYHSFLRNNNISESFDLDNLLNLYNNSEGEQKDKLFEQIVEGSLILVYSFVINYYNYYCEVNPIFDIDDVIQEGNILLLKAIKYYDSTKGSFTTYLFNILSRNLYYVMGISNCAVEFGKTKGESYKKIKRELYLGMSDEDIISHNWISERQFRLVKPFLLGELSLDEIIDNEIVLSYEDMGIQKVIDFDSVSAKNKVIYKAIDKLKPKQKKIILRSFGLRGNEVESCSSINEDLNYSGKAIYTAKKQALQRLKKYLAGKVDLTENDYTEYQKTYYLDK